MYYILRILPPIGDLTKYRYETLQELIHAISQLRESLDIFQLDISQKSKQNWRENPDDCFQECILINKINPEKSPHHERFFRNTQEKPTLVYSHIGNPLSSRKEGDKLSPP
jgi:hypothetical protein